MGLLGAVFGGGTKLELVLDTPQTAPSGVVGGKVLVVGGKKPYKVTELAVVLQCIRVTPKPDSQLPDIDTREIGKQIVTAGTDLPPGASQTYAFKLHVPHDAPLSSSGLFAGATVSYKVVAMADIPGVMDPSDAKDLKVVDGAKDMDRPKSAAEIMQKYPGLQSGSEDQQVEAAREIFLAAYSEADQLQEIAPYLAQMMFQGTIRVRRAALEAWANLVDNRVRPEHLQALHQVASLPNLDEETLEQVVIACCKFAEEGALPLVQHFMRHPDVSIRKAVANNLRFNASSKFNGKRELLNSLVQDPDPSVRAAAIGAFSPYMDDQQIAIWIAQLADHDQAPTVQAACVGAMIDAHFNNNTELAMQVFERHVQNPNEEVRKEVASNLNWLPEGQMQRVWQIVQRLIQDPSEEVRRSMAFQFINMEKFPQLLPLAQHVAENDPSDDVRREALSGVAGVSRPEQCIPYYRQKIAQGAGQNEEVLWAMLSGLRHHREHPEAKRMLSEFGQAPFPHLANAARETLSW